jgi:uncharacterized protein YdhG (YjbR/CyaY superfamily)
MKNEIDQYIESFSTEIQGMLQDMRTIILKNAPKAEEVISYKMPAFKYHGMLVYFAGFKNHVSLFPANTTLIQSFEQELKGFKTSKGTIQFQVGQKLPKSLIQKIVKIRVKENEEKALAKMKS